MIGYIIKCEDGKNLTKDLFWYNHEESEGEQPYVFSNSGLIYVSEICGDWNIKPSHKIPATWDEKDGVRIVGEIEPFWK